MYFELSIKYHKIGTFVLSFVKLKVVEELQSGFRNPKLKIVAILKKTQFYWFGEKKSSFTLILLKEPNENMVHAMGHLLFPYFKNLTLCREQLLTFILVAINSRF